MSMDWIRVGVREEHIRSLFKEDAWKRLFETFPEIQEVSVIGEKGTGKPSLFTSNDSKGDWIELYVKTEDSFETKKERQSMRLIMKLYRFLVEEKLTKERLEVKLETKRLGDYSGFVLRDDLEKPISFWHHQGIPGFSERVVFERSTEIE